MNWKRTFAVVFSFSLVVSILSSVFGVFYWSALGSSYYAKIPLQSADKLLKFAKVVNKSVVYSFDIFWAMEPGKTRVQAYVEGIKCKNSNYTIEVIVMDGRIFKNSGKFSFLIKRKDTFLYLHVKVTIPNTCAVDQSLRGPGVIIYAKNE
ncbi:hypothetical protein [Pyrococcus kukulkanii]|uniref:Uncharacterized protein n=1 Tax=Pyrococcus kukulkanii TaxID=1609559 RepID=A0A127B8Q9_9EURY|nr:hypothetical protein [Pyrococcus kukulkanii]AMM53762.1 hypothetical protein TQ32_04140 [Pyrococcus kukulkanii]